MHFGGLHSALSIHIQCRFLNCSLAGTRLYCKYNGLSMQNIQEEQEEDEQDDDDDDDEEEEKEKVEEEEEEWKLENRLK
ncbi:unnamed protein product [Schistosoma curassoni]|uniref:Uncharacterized protein n=1 Tax=Schistosoma curassoni TaxID=6186 RepID=A0A183K568_9TREM|nr:unnamed protein product [Schistosoma curassoni]